MNISTLKSFPRFAMKEVQKKETPKRKSPVYQLIIKRLGAKSSPARGGSNNPKRLKIKKARSKRRGLLKKVDPISYFWGEKKKKKKNSLLKKKKAKKGLTLFKLIPKLRFKGTLKKKIQISRDNKYINLINFRSR